MLIGLARGAVAEGAVTRVLTFSPLHAWRLGVVRLVPTQGEQHLALTRGALRHANREREVLQLGQVPWRIGQRRMAVSHLPRQPRSDLCQMRPNRRRRKQQHDVVPER